MLDRFRDAKSALNESQLNEVLQIDDSVRDRLHAVLLEIYLDILWVCQKQGIIPYLIGGSALGSIRHKGFIPWDDDLDIGMTRKDYECFKEIFEAELGDKYILCAPNCQGVRAKNRFPKVIRKGTLFREVLDSHDPAQCGIFVDIFILENVPDSRLKRLIKGWRCEILEFVASQVFLCENMDDDVKRMYEKLGKGNFYLRLLTGRIFSFRESCEWFNAVDRAVQYNDESTRFCAIATGRKHYFGEILEKSRLFPGMTGEFEGHEVPLFRDQDYYLSNLYGDYMKIPPVEKREKHFVKEIRF